MEQTKLWNRPYIFILIINTFNAFSFYMIATVLSKYLVSFGTDISLAGFIVGLFSLTSLVCRPFCGIMADRLNNVRLLKLSNIFMTVGLVGFILTTSIPLIIFFRVLHGIGFAIGGTAQIALASRYIPAGRMGEGIGYQGTGMVVASAVAPGIGLMITEQIGMPATFLAAAVLTVVAFFLLFAFQEQSEQARKAFSPKDSKKRLSWSDVIAVKALPYTFVASTFSFTNGIIAAYLVLYAENLGITGVSVYFTVCAAVLFVVRPFSGKLMDKKGLHYTVLPGLLVTASSLFILGRSASLPLILLTGALRSLGQGAAQPSLQAGCINRVGREKTGVATSTYYLGGDVGQGIGPMLGGLIIGQLAGIAGYRTYSYCLNSQSPPTSTL